MGMADLERLTREQLDYFNDEGYVLFKKPVLSEKKFSGLREHFEELLANLKPGQRPELMDVPHFVDTKLFEWLFDDEILDLVGDILGPDIDLFSSHFISKPAGGSMRVPWHEDSAYWKGMLEPMEVVTVWLAIDESNEENGCMYVIPRTHDNGYSEYYDVDPNKNVFISEIRKGQFDEGLKRPLILQPNQASLHHAKIIHGSPSNTSAKRRTGYTMRYVRSSTALDKDNRANHQLYHARGKDYGKTAYGDPSRSYPEIFVDRVMPGH
jgi:hypothetical protein